MSKTAAFEIKSHFTTGEAAKIIGVATKTVIDWCEAGRLPFERLHPDDRHRHRRIARLELLRFVSAAELTLRQPLLQPLAVSYCLPAPLQQALRERLAGRYFYQQVECPLSLGLLIERSVPRVIVTDLSQLTDREIQRLALTLRAEQPWAGVVKLLGVLRPEQENELERKNLLRLGFTWVLPSYQFDELLTEAEQLLRPLVPTS